MKISVPPTSDRIDEGTLASDALPAAKPEKLFIPLAARNLVANSDVIRPLPQLLIKLCNYLDYATASLTELAKDISVDPRMTAKLLRLANSTAVGRRHRITNVFDAVNLLGARKTVSLVISTNVVDAQSKLLRKLPQELRNWCHSRNVLIASTASVFARRLDNVLPDTAYVLGLLQDIGILILAYAHGNAYQNMLDRVQEQGYVGLDVIEKGNFGVTHAEVSAAQLQKWDLPASMISMVLYHHHPEKAPQENSSQQLLHVMRVGEAMANLADKCTPQRHQHLLQLLAAYGEAHAKECRACLAEAISITAQSKQIFSVPAANADLLNRLLAKIDSEGPMPEGEPNAEPADVSLQENLDQFLGERRDGDSAARAPVNGGDASVHRQRTIVIINDEPLQSKFIAKVLEPIGLEVKTCTSFEAAREHARDAAVILCDIQLRIEEGDGADVVRALRKDGFKAPVIIMSTDCSRATVTKCIEAGTNAFLLKPFDNPTLLEKVSKFTSGLAEQTVPTVAAAS